MRKYKVTNNDDGIVKEFDNENDFIEFAKTTYHENEAASIYPNELIWLPETLNNAVEYIEEWNEHLILEEL